MQNARPGEPSKPYRRIRKFLIGDEYIDDAVLDTHWFRMVQSHGDFVDAALALAEELGFEIEYDDEEDEDDG